MLLSKRGLAEKLEVSTAVHKVKGSGGILWTNVASWATAFESREKPLARNRCWLAATRGREL